MVSWMWLSLSISHARLSAITWSIALNSKSNSLSWSMSPVFDRRMSGVIVSDSGFMDSELMMDYIDKVIRPYI